jgi:transposase
MMSELQIKNKIYELEKEIEVYKKVLETPKNGSMGRPKGTSYSPEQVSFLEECAKKKMPWTAIVREFNAKFKTSVKEDSRQLYNLMRREGIIEINSKRLMAKGEYGN